MNTELIGVAIGALAGLTFPFFLVAAAGRKGGAKDRRSLLDAGLTAVLGVLLCRLLVPWYVVPPLLWAVPVGITAYGVVLAVRAWPGLPWLTGKYRGLSVAGTVISLAVTGLALLTLT